MGVGCRGQQTHQQLGEYGLVWVRPATLLQPCPRSTPASEIGQRHDIAESGFRQTWIQTEGAVVLDQRGIGPPHPTQHVSELQSRL